MAVSLEDMTMEELGEWVMQKFGSEVKDAFLGKLILYVCYSGACSSFAREIIIVDMHIISYSYAPINCLPTISPWGSGWGFDQAKI